MRAVQAFALAICLAVPFALAGCGGGSDTPATASMPGGGALARSGSGPTPPIMISIADADISSIHLEMTDNVQIKQRGAPNSIRDLVSGEAADYSVRNEVTCPGVPPNGNKCVVTRTEIDGVWHDHAEFDIGEHFLDEIKSKNLDSWESSILGLWRVVGIFNAPGGLGANQYWGGHGKHMGYITSSFGGPRIQWPATYSTAFGNLYSDYPTAEQHESGSGRWMGYMDGATRILAIPVSGSAAVNYDFATNTVDVAITHIHTNSNLVARERGMYDGPDAFAWSDLQVNDDGSFYIQGHGNHRANTELHPTLGYIDGDFYGPNAEEVAGVFERQFGNGGDAVVGAFGAIRQPE